MAHEWAKAFYRSRAWRECREAYGRSKVWICERCEKPGKIVHHKQPLTPQTVNDPDIALNWDNLELLCHDCHDEERYAGERVTRPGYGFDVEGNLIAVD